MRKATVFSPFLQNETNFDLSIGFPGQNNLSKIEFTLEGKILLSQMQFLSIRIDPI